MQGGREGQPPQGREARSPRSMSRAGREVRAGGRGSRRGGPWRPAEHGEVRTTFPRAPGAAPAGVTASVSAQPSVWQTRAGGGTRRTGCHGRGSAARPPRRAEGAEASSRVCALFRPQEGGTFTSRLGVWLRQLGAESREPRPRCHGSCLEGSGCGLRSGLHVASPDPVTAHSRGCADRALWPWGPGLSFGPPPPPPPRGAPPSPRPTHRIRSRLHGPSCQQSPTWGSNPRNARS